MSPIEIRPTTLPSSTTGKWRNLPIVIISMMPATVSDSRQLTTLRVMTALTGSSSTLAPRSPSTRTMSRSDKNTLKPSLVHHQHGADLAFAKDLDRRRKLGVRLDALDLVALGVEN